MLSRGRDGDAGAAAAPTGRERPGAPPAWCSALVLYAGLSVLLVLNVWTSHGRAFVGGDGDPQLLIWNLGWTPFGLTHGGHRPLVTDFISYPAQVNMMWNASLVFPALVLWPVTAAFGPLASYNLLATLTPAAGGFCAFLALRRYAGAVGACVGGLVYGFSPYVMAQMGGHTHVAIAVYPPLLLLGLDEICVRQRHPPWIAGGLLGVASAAQLLTGEEVLATSVLIGAIALGLLCALHPGGVRARLRSALAGLGAAAGVGGVLAAYPLRVQFLGPAQVHGALQAKNTYVTDLLGPIVPTAFQHFHTDAAIATQLRFTGNMSESNAYLGVPLLVLLLLGFPLLRRSAVGLFAGLMTLIVLLLSMGPRLHVDGRDTGIHLPWALIGNRGPLQNALPSRLAVHAFLMIAILLALLLDRALADRRRSLAAAGCAAVALALLPLLPSAPIVDTTPDNPAFFTSAAVERIPPGSVVLVTPYASGASLTARAMLWQAESNYRFRMPEGQAFRTGPTQDPPPSALQSALVAVELGQNPAVDTARIAQLRADLRALKVSTVVVGPSPHRAAALALLRGVLAGAPEEVDGVSVFWDVAEQLGPA